MPTFALAIQKGAIAQLVEQRTENPCVPGSIPGGTTIKAVVSLRQLLFLYVSFLDKVTTELQLPIRPIMSRCRLRCLVRGSGVIWRIYVFFYHEGNHLNIQKMIEPTQCSLKNVI